jgi:hypothetical protein
MTLVLGTNCGFVTSAPSGDPGSSQGASDNRAIAFRLTAATNMTITEMGIYMITATEDSTIELGIYSSDGDNSTPDTLLGSGSMAKGTTAGWKVISGLDIELTSGTVYWLAWQQDDTATQSNTRTNNTSSRRAYIGSATTLPSPWGTSTSEADNVFYAVYALYTEAPGTPGIKVNIGDVWKDVTAVQVNIGDTWKTVTKGEVNIGDVWKTFYGS